jgi:regulator of protease activity HflC (stomatin/prohibitin superfamily)
VKSSGATIDREGNYVITPEDFSLIWNELAQLEFEVKARDSQVKSLEYLVRREQERANMEGARAKAESSRANTEGARANREAAARAKAQIEVAEKTLIIRVFLVTCVVLVGGGITVGVLTK